MANDKKWQSSVERRVSPLSRRIKATVNRKRCDSQIDGVTNEAVNNKLQTEVPRVVTFSDFNLKHKTSPKEIPLLEYIFSNASSSEIIAQTDICSLSRFDFRFLGPNEELEVEVVTMVSSILTEHARSTSKNGGKINWYLPARITKEHLPQHNLPLSKSWERMRYFERYMGLLDECNEIYIPILHKNHFILSRIMIDKGVVEVWDSFAHPDTPIYHKTLIVGILRALDMGFKEQLKSKPANYNFASFAIVRGRNVPRQPNNFDCGVFVILFMIKHCQVDSSTFQFNSNKERCRIAWWIAKSDYNKRKTELLEKAQSFI